MVNISEPHKFLLKATVRVSLLLVCIASLNWEFRLFRFLLMNSSHEYTTSPAKCRTPKSSLVFFLGKKKRLFLTARDLYLEIRSFGLDFFIAHVSSNILNKPLAGSWNKLRTAELSGKGRNFHSICSCRYSSCSIWHICWLK